MRFWLRRLLSIDLGKALVGAVLLHVVAIFAPSNGADDRPPAVAKPNPKAATAPKPKPKITVSKQTTYILKPVDSDGFVDYLGALNQKGSQGVTPVSNAGVLLVRAWGAKEFEPRERLRYYQLLRIEPPPDGSPLLTDFEAFVVKKSGREPTTAEFADFGQSLREPWSTRQSPLLAEWVTANEKPLELVLEATRRTRCYLPLVAPVGSGIADMPLPGAASRAAARLLTARAMSEIAAGKITEAERDLLACHRLARLYGHTPFSIPALVAYVEDAMACAGDARLMDSAHPSAERALAYQRELRGLEPLPTLVDAIEAERFQFLDTIISLARQGPPADLDARGGNVAIFGNLQSRWASLNWDDALAFGNEQFDRAIAAARKPSVPERNVAFRQYDREMRAASAKARRGSSDLSAIFSVLQNNRERQMGEVLTFLLMPALQATSNAEDRAHTREALGQVGFALAAYHADHGTYPESLNALSPKYITRVPNDLYTEQPLHYRREGAGCLLYSVGANGVDDGGRTFDSQPPGDDIVLRLSGGPRPKH